MKPTDTNEFLNSLNAGIFAQQLGRALSDVASGCIEHSKQGQVTITFKLKQIGQSNQVNVSHTLDYLEPTKRGKRREDTTLDTPLCLRRGSTIFSVTNQPTQMISKEEAPVIGR